MESPFIFPEESQDFTFSLNPHEKTHGFVHPWWRDPMSELGGENLSIDSDVDQGKKELEKNLTTENDTSQEPFKDSSRDPHSIEEGRTIILLFSIVFLILIIIILCIWVKRMKNAQVCNTMLICVNFETDNFVQESQADCDGSLPDYDTATEMKVTDVDLPTYSEAAQISSRFPMLSLI